MLCLVERTEVFQAESCTLSLSGYQPKGLICELLPIIAHSQGYVKVRGSSLAQRWSSGGNVRSTEGKIGGCRGDLDFQKRGNLHSQCNVFY